jgi:phytoene dehydrogenase-like protein
MTDVAVVGAGHNGLVAAFYLAKAGWKPHVFERREEIGGGAVTETIHPGFQCPTLSHEVLLEAGIVRALDLARYGLEPRLPGADVCALHASGPPLVLWDDATASVASIRRLSARDADTYVAYCTALRRVASVLATAFGNAPPAIDRPDARDVWNLFRAGRKFRALGRRDGYRLLRWGPMPIADLVSEWFETDLLRAAIAAPALTGTMLGPRSAGSALVLLMREAHRQLAGGRPVRAKGGPGAVTRAIAAAARAAGAEIHANSPVERILIRDGRASGVVVGGREIRTARVLSAVDPRTTFERLIEATELTPDFALKIRNYRASGTVAKVNLALSGLPAFDTDRTSLSGRVHIGGSLDYLERAFDHAKYGEISSAPWLEMTVPSIGDPDMAPPGAHVASIYVHYVPYRLRGDWGSARDRLLDTTLDLLERHAPGIRRQVVAAQVITPADLEATYGFAGGHIFHGELALDQLFTMRPLLGFARYATPVAGLYLCGAGTHPGGFMTGTSGRLAAAEMIRARQI